jgi:NodT family efflux transporter outer membrane factor (OMF) lipoprotein
MPETGKKAAMKRRSFRNRWIQRGRLVLTLCLTASVALGQCGCTTGLVEYVRNGFKVGPNYQRPPVPLTLRWIDQENARVRVGEPNLATWWEVFDDPILSGLIRRSYSRNLTLRATGFQILEARAQRAIALGELFPQTQTFNAQYTHSELSRNVGVGTGGGGSGAGGGGRFVDNVSTSANLAWELDFWGLFRRSVEAADATLDQSVDNYDEMMVQLFANVATFYVQIRTLQKRLALARQNVALQEPLVATYEKRYKAGVANSSPGYFQLRSNLENTRALIPLLELSLRQANNQLCVLLGLPVRDLLPELGDGAGPDPKDKTKSLVLIPRPKDESIVVGIQGDLLLRRPDVLAAEALVRNQSAQIGVSEAQMYPHVAMNGSIGLAANSITKLFSPGSWTGSIGPSLSWAILNYGRLLGNVRLQNATYQADVATYQNTLLTANQEAESALAGYLLSLDQARHLQESADSAAQLTAYLVRQFKLGYLPPGAADTSAFINQMFTAVNFQVNQQDAAAQAEGNIALNLILLYRAMGGGWQTRPRDIVHFCPDTSPDDLTLPVTAQQPPPEVQIIPDELPKEMLPPPERTPAPKPGPGKGGGAAQSK